MSKEPNAILLNPRWVGYQLTGRIYFDDKQRWEDGTPVTTSMVLTIEDDIVRTRNSTYVVVYQ